MWVGALVTAGLFNIGKYLIGLYLGTSGVATAYGRCAASEPTDGWGWTGTSELGCWLMNPLFRAFGFRGAPEPGKSPVRAAPGARTGTGAPVSQPWRRRSTRKASVTARAARASSMPVSISWSGQKCEAGW